MRGAIYTAIVAIPVALALFRSRPWLAAQVAGRRGRLWCALGALGVGMIPALLARCLLPATATAMRQHVVFAALALPVLVGAAWLRWRAARAGSPAAPVAADPVPVKPLLAEPPLAPAVVPSGREDALAVAPLARTPPTRSKQGAEDETAGNVTQRPAAGTPLDPQSPAPAQPPVAPRTRSATRPSPAAAALRAVRAADEPEEQEQPSKTPTTVTECILSMSISCEECLLRNFQEMARAPLPEAQRETLTRLVEETDDKLARLRAARRRHHGEELVRVVWSQLPEVDLPVVSPGSSLAQIREKARRQTEVMIGFYRTVATYAQRPSLKSLLATLALDGQRHLSVIEQSG